MGYPGHRVREFRSRRDRNTVATFWTSVVVLLA